MNAKFVTIAGFAFCRWLFLIERAFSTPVSPSLWLPSLWILRCASRPIGFWLSGGAPESLEGWHDPAFFTICTILGWIVLLRRAIDWHSLLKRNRWLFLFFAYMLVSVLWAPDAATSSKRWVRAFGDLTMALVIVTEPNVVSAYTTVLKRCVVFLIPMSVVLIKFIPSMGRGFAKHWGPDPWIGVATHKNTLGQLCFVAVMWLVCEVVRRRKMEKSRDLVGYKHWLVPAVCAALTLWLLNGGGHSSSSTSILASILGVAMYLILGRLRDRPEVFTKWLAWGLAGWVLLFPVSDALLGGSLYDVVLATQGKDRTLTDRTMLWEDCIAIGMRSPILGSGYGGFWTPATVAEIAVRNTNAPEQSHNGYIEIFLQLGGAGILLFAVVAVGAFRGAMGTLVYNFGAGRLRVAFLVPVFVHNYAEAGFPRPTHLMWFVFLIFALNYGTSTDNRLHSDVSPA